MRMKDNIMKKNTDNEVDDLVDDLVSYICELAEEKRAQSYINDESDIGCLIDSLKNFDRMIESYQRCTSKEDLSELPSMKDLEKLHEEMTKL